MKDLSNRGEFEKRWKEAFEDKEMMPSDHVWDKIDARLANEDARRSKKRLFIFQLLAAASVVFALGIGAYTWFYVEDFDGSTQQNAQKIEGNVNNDSYMESKLPEASGKSEEAIDHVEGTITENGKQNHQASSEVFIGHADVSGRSAKNNTILPQDGYNDMSPLALVDEPDKKEEFIEPLEFNVPQDELYAFIEGIGIALEPMHFESPHIEGNDQMNYYNMPLLPKKEEEEDKKRIWAGLSYSAGSYNPNTNKSNGLMASSDSYAQAYDGKQDFYYAGNQETNLVAQEYYAPPAGSKPTNYQSDMMNSFGVSVNMRFSDRLYINGGLQYLQANTVATTTTYFLDKTSNKVPVSSENYRYAATMPAEVSSQPPQEITNTLEYASIPVRVGFLIIDKRFDWSILTGVSSDFLLKSTVRGDDPGFTNVVNTPGSDSPYRTVYYNGMLATNIGYTIAERYYFHFEPSLKVGLNNITKSDALYQSKPVSSMVTFGVTYIFE